MSQQGVSAITISKFKEVISWEDVTASCPAVEHFPKDMSVSVCVILAVKMSVSRSSLLIKWSLPSLCSVLYFHLQIRRSVTSSDPRACARCACQAFVFMVSRCGLLILIAIGFLIVQCR